MSTLQELRTASTPNLPQTSVGLTDTNSFELAQRVAKVFSASDLVPAIYKGNIANSIIALNMAYRMEADPLMVMQNLYVVHGRPAWSSQFLIATFNKCGRFTSMRFEFRGDEKKDDYGCRAYAIEKATDNTLYGSWIDIAMAKAEGWYGKTGSKWKTMPEQMLMYRAASFFVRTHAPELAMGLHTAEEIKDGVIDMTATEDGKYGVTLDDIKDVSKPVSPNTEKVSELPKKERKAKVVDPEDKKQSDEVKTVSPFVQFDEIQAEDPEGAAQALMDAGFTNEPVSDTGMAKVVEAYHFAKKQQ